MLTGKCTAARTSFALALSAESQRNRTRERQLHEKVGGLTPAGLFSWFAFGDCATA